MKQKTRFLSILALLLMAVTGAVAQEPTTYSVTLAEGTEDADKWTITPNSGLNEGAQVNIQYNGTRRIRSITAVQVAAAEEAWDGDLAKLTGEEAADYATATDGMTITGTLTDGVNMKVMIADGANVTLDGVTIIGKNEIDYDTWESRYPWAGLTCLGDATITLTGTNTVKGFSADYPGIHVPQGKTLTILGDGSLTASSNGDGCGIGGGNQIACGNIVIAGGTVTATGGSGSPGIGGGKKSSCGSVTITKGVTRVTATKGYGAPNSIGAGNEGTGGTVTIGCTLDTDGSPVGGMVGDMTTSPFTYPWDGNLSALTGEESEDFTTATNGTTITGTLPSGVNVKVSIADGANVVLKDATINGVNNDIDYKWAGLTCLGDAIITLEGESTVKGFHKEYPGIYVPEGKTLTIRGEGSLTASPHDGGTNNSFATGIGAKYQSNCGNIRIEGGTVVANGGYCTAGIGACGSRSCGDITITGGNVTAKGGRWAAGIGGGYNASICGKISIEGGTVTAQGGEDAAGIGSGTTGSSCGNINITGGTVNATGNTGAAGIGSGNGSSCGNITITDGVTKVTATKGTIATNSIGAGKNGSCGTVSITASAGKVVQN